MYLAARLQRNKWSRQPVSTGASAVIFAAFMSYSLSIFREIYYIGCSSVGLLVLHVNTKSSSLTPHLTDGAPYRWWRRRCSRRSHCSTPSHIYIYIFFSFFLLDRLCCIVFLNFAQGTQRLYSRLWCSQKKKKKKKPYKYPLLLHTSNTLPIYYIF